MKFFIPTIEPENAEDFLENSVIRFIETQGFKIIRDKRIYSITFKHNGKLFTDTVGKISLSNNESIFVILETEQMYLVCTTNRGILRGEPMITGKLDVDVSYFE